MGGAKSSGIHVKGTSAVAANGLNFQASSVDIFSVFCSSNNCFKIPDHYLPTRWLEASSITSSEMQSEKIQNCKLEAFLDRYTVGNAINIPSDSLILPEVEDSGGTVNFTIENPRDSITPGKLEKEGITRVLAAGVLDMMHQIVQ
ncbi:hypothetical protein SADUNF_Sadunf10G0106600 [Salix dunnii]|uniref:Uncharacterized protein n=1 Tax=Salix dunnii TaxID=1413687 RepID=A0A835JN06_9ROSI|nr:hypothetical protein SADUNF_Sadunf10G0106600 [Salix dunnii]